MNISASKAMFLYLYFHVDSNNFHYYLVCTILVQILGFYVIGYYHFLCKTILTV